MNRRQWIFALQAAVTLVLLAVLFRGFDWARFWSLAQATPAWLYVGSFAVVVLGTMLYTLRWQLVLRVMGVELPFARLLQQYLIGVFFSNFLPSTVGGDWARIYYLGRERGYPVMAASVFMDRFLGFFSLSVAGVVLAWTLQLPAGPFIVGRTVLTFLLAGFLVSFGVSFWVPVERLAAVLPGRGAWWTRARGGVTEFLAPVRTTLRRPLTILGVMAIVLTYASLVSAVYFGFFRAAGGEIPPFLSILTAVVIIAVLANVPITVNGIGLREQLHFLLFVALGVPKEVSVSVSLLMFAHVLMVSLGGSWLWIRWKRIDVPVAP